jgi:hypothetical protein
VLEREREETKEAESSVAAFRRQVASQQEAVAALDAEIEQYRARVANLRKGPFHRPYAYALCAHRHLRLIYPFRTRDRAENFGRECGASICRIACLRACFGLYH